MAYMPYIGIKQAKILGICKLYGQINTEIITRIYKGNQVVNVAELWKELGL